ncbi:MAG: type II toxin-antitoxin system RatA family toxin [Betaproteobacteria bacterium]|nr:type II toxin-antitoxin system RatA family toxin [Betaproteobacteria bacterium]MDH3437519.1 type II toxin-antitoxin system RatA family toxin [Betaproteobacteria bacterium]
MPEVNRSVLVDYTPEQMFALVDAVERYPEFLPWCGGARVSQGDETRTRATIEISYRGIKQSFTTENAKRPPSAMDIRLVEGPFRELDGHWRFTGLGESGCKVEFRLRYEFSNRLLAKLLGPVFDFIANSLVEAFVKRADRLYG